MITNPIIQEKLGKAVQRTRLLDTARRLIGIPSRTGEAGAVSDTLAKILESDGFEVLRPIGGHPAAPAVVARYDSGKPGRTIQFEGHLDTVHLPFVPPGEEDNRLKGSGAADMKGGLACAIEALRILRDTQVLNGGGVLFTAHDLHEAPWGFGQQLDALIREGIHGDGVLIPEPLTGHLPMVGRGAATWKAIIRRGGAPVHEVMRPLDEPSVIAAGAELVTRLQRLDGTLSKKNDLLAGSESVFIGQFHAGEIYNQFPQEAWLQGTRRWLPETDRSEVEREFRHLIGQLGQDTRTSIDLEFLFIRDAFRLLPDDPLVRLFQQGYSLISGKPLPTGPKPFVDDGNSFFGLGRIPAITHGPSSGGQHTVHEWVMIDDMLRVAQLYALVAVLYCAPCPS